MLMVGLTFAVIVCAGSNASGFLWEQSSLLFRSNSIHCPNRFQFKIVPCEIKWKIRAERLSYEILASCFISVIISVAGSYTLRKLTRRESKKISMRKKFLFFYILFEYMIEKQESFITNLIVKRTYLQDIRIFSLFSTNVISLFSLPFQILY